MKKAKGYKDDEREVYPISIRVAKNIKRLMKINGIERKKDLAKMTENSNGFVSQVLSGKRNISLENLARFADALNVPACVLVNEEHYTQEDLEFLVSFHKAVKERNKKALRRVRSTRNVVNK